jgi:FtsP/CotA-like multicopper oxidase with cupredoxin domain
MNQTNAREQDDLFATKTAGLPEVARPGLIRLHDGGRLDLRIGAVRKSLGGAELRMLGYNGSVPGPVLHVDQGSRITVQVRNDGDVDATVHWHGLRLDNRYDGVPHETQAPIPVGGTFTYQLQFPDAGFYWYHPHIREDYGLEMGLYGTIIVEPADLGYWPPASRQLTLTLDDLFVEDGRIAPFRRSGPTFVAMGRFGNVMLINGETEFSGQAAVGEVVRLYVVNTANTRIFNFAIRGARAKLVGGDSGRYEHETFTGEVLLAPSERAVIDVLFDTPGQVRLEHRTPGHTYDLGAFTVTEGAPSDAAGSFEVLRTDPELAAVHQAIGHDIERPPDKVLAFYSLMDMMHGDEDTPASSPAASDAPPPAAEPGPGAAHGGHEHGDGLEWEDQMLEMNRASDPSNMIWQLIDRETGAVNGDISWAFTVGDRVKIRLINQMDSDHPMHHPFHIHGAGRFLILSRDGKPEVNLVWKDTVLLRAGETVDILLDVSNPGLWMAHCHIAEHNQAGMMFSFNVARDRELAR